jgi:hypothetical protein
MKRTLRTIIIACILANLVLGAPFFVKTSEMVSNSPAMSGLIQLVDMLNRADVDTRPLTQALVQHALHQEGPDAGGVFLIDGLSGSTLVPGKGLKGFTKYGSTIIDVDDQLTHTILPATVINYLGNRQFLDGQIPNQSANTAIHELLHAMAFRTGCLKGSQDDEEELVTSLSSDVELKLFIYLIFQSGNQATALRLYNDMARSIAQNLSTNKKWSPCYQILGMTKSVLTFEFTGVVTELQERGGAFLAGKVTTGNLISGSFTYHVGAQDIVPADSSLGQYHFRTVPSGISVTISGSAGRLTFATDAIRFDGIALTVIVENGSGIIPSDVFTVVGFGSSTNWPLPTIGDNLVGIGLADVSPPLTMVKSDALPACLNLAAENQNVGTVYSSDSVRGYSITFRITDLTKCPQLR